MRGFWETHHAEAIRFTRRRGEALQLVLPLEPPTKKTRAGTRRKASDLLDEVFETDALVQYARQQTRWPKPRAAIALDIEVFGASPNGPRIDSICKWLLDELAGRVYTDDRQVKLLFARTWRRNQCHPPTLSRSGVTPPHPSRMPLRSDRR